MSDINNNTNNKSINIINDNNSGTPSVTKNIIKYFDKISKIVQELKESGLIEPLVNKKTFIPENTNIQDEIIIEPLYKSPTNGNMVILNTPPQRIISKRIMESELIGFFSNLISIVENNNIQNSNNNSASQSKIEKIKYFNYEGSKPIVYLTNSRIEIWRTFLIVPNFDKNWYNDSDMPDTIYYPLENCNYSTLVHLLCYMTIHSLSFREFSLLLGIYRTPFTTIRLMNNEIQDIYEKLKDIKFKTNLIHDILATINKSINPQVNVKELLRYGLHGETIKELMDWENVWNTIVKNIPAPKLSFELQKVIIENYTILGRYTLKETTINGISDNGIFCVNETKSEFIDSRQVVHQSKLLRSRVSAINGSTPIINITDYNSISVSAPSVDNNKDTINISLPTATWEDAISLSSSLNDITAYAINYTKNGNFTKDGINFDIPFTNIIPEHQSLSINVKSGKYKFSVSFIAVA